MLWLAGLACHEPEVIAAASADMVATIGHLAKLGLTCASTAAQNLGVDHHLQRKGCRPEANDLKHRDDNPSSWSAF